MLMMFDALMAQVKLSALKKVYIFEEGSASDEIPDGVLIVAVKINQAVNTATAGKHETIMLRILSLRDIFFSIKTIANAGTNNIAIGCISTAKVRRNPINHDFICLFLARNPVARINGNIETYFILSSAFQVVKDRGTLNKTIKVVKRETFSEKYCLIVQ